MQTCPCCEGSGVVPDELETEVENIREWCRANGAGPFHSDEIKQSDAARYMDRSQKTFRNHYKHKIPIQRHRGRVYYRISDFALFILQKDED